MKRKRSDQESARVPSGAAVMRADLTEGLYRALFQEWAEVGYRALSLERVAARAGAGKAAIYRRWSSKLEFATDAIERIKPPLTELPAQDSLAADIETYLLQLRRTLRHPLVRRILPDLYAEQARGSELSPLLQGLAQYRRDTAGGMIDRAMARGEIPPTTDRRFALDLIPSPLYWRMIMIGGRISTADIRRQAKAMTAALKA